jgi:hypothetical protein
MNQVEPVKVRGWCSDLVFASLRPFRWGFVFRGRIGHDGRFIETNERRY